MDDYMALVIDDSGNVDYLGYKFCFGYHAQCLMKYIIDKYPKLSKILECDYMEQPLKPMFFLNALHTIVFTNVSTDDEKRGVLYIPNSISKVQAKACFEFLESIRDYDIEFVSGLQMEDDLVVGDLCDKNIDLNSFVR